jgi:3-oxoacyl-[acyl-carrier-protein] synthase-3
VVAIAPQVVAQCIRSMRLEPIPPGQRAWHDTRSVSVLGMGMALPGGSIATDDLLDHMRMRFGQHVQRKGTVLAKRLGVRGRHVCRDFVKPLESPRAGDTNAELAARAVSAALQEAGLEPDDLEYLIGHTTTPGSALPPNIARVAQLLGYRGPFVELRQACTGFANALIMAFGLLHRAGCGPVAIVGSETGSVYFDPRRVAEDSGQLVNLLQMGDAAGACVLAPLSSATAASRISHVYHGHLGLARAAAFFLKCGGSDRPPGSEPVMEFEHDFRAVREHGPELFMAACNAARSCGIEPGSVDFFIPHQVNGRIAEHLARVLELAEGQIFVNADRVGNTGSAAIWLALAELRGRLDSGNSVCVLGVEATQYMFGGFRYVHA